MTRFGGRAEFCDRCGAFAKLEDCGKWRIVDNGLPSVTDPIAERKPTILCADCNADFDRFMVQIVRAQVEA